MSMPSNEPRLFVPSQPQVPTGPVKIYLANRHGAVTSSHTISPLRTDPGFFKNLLAALNPLRQTSRRAMVMSGVGIAVLALDVVATLNLGNPALFYGRRDRWRELSGLLGGNRTDMWRSYFDDIAPHWRGHSVELLQQYIRFNIHELYAYLAEFSDEMSRTMQGQLKEVSEYDASVFALYATSAPVLKTLAASSAHPVGRTALRAQLSVFGGALIAFVTQFADVFSSYQSDLNRLELKMNGVRAAFYPTGNPTEDLRKLALDDNIENLDGNWIPA